MVEHVLPMGHQGIADNTVVTHMELDDSPVVDTWFCLKCAVCETKAGFSKTHTKREITKCSISEEIRH